MAHSAYERIEHAGGAAETTLSGTFAAAASSFSVDDATNWPTGGTGKFVVVIDPGESAEEKILCSTRTGTTINVDARAFDGTSDVQHESGATVRHVFSAVEADEANQAVNNTLGTVTTAEDLLVASSATALKRVGVGSNGNVLRVASNTVGWGALPDGAVSSSAKFAANVVDAAAVAGDAISDHFAIQVFNGTPGTSLGSTGSGFTKVADLDVTLPAGWSSMSLVIYGFVWGSVTTPSNLSGNSGWIIVQLEESAANLMNQEVRIGPFTDSSGANDVYASAPLAGDLTGQSGTVAIDLEADGNKSGGSGPGFVLNRYNVVVLKLRES